MKKIISSFIICLVLFSAGQASAHNPRLVWDINTTSKTPIVIEKPEISQAFYGILKNSPDYYKIVITEPSIVYFNLLIPDNNNASIGLSAKMIKLNSPDSDIKMTLDGEKTIWEDYYEFFFGDYYLKGPEETKYLRTGEYLIEINSIGNTGKYVLSVGEKEYFPLNETMRAIFTFPKLKLFFFENPFYMLSSGILGRLLSVTALFMLLLTLMGLRKKREIKVKNKNLKKK
jgi:hypothetical protein